MGAPNTHSMSSLSSARHVHWSSRCGIVMSWGLEFWLLALLSVQHLVCLFDCSECVIWCITLL